MLLNVWFLVTLGLAPSFHHHSRITSYTWAQVLAWVGGAALWLSATFTARLVRGRGDRPRQITELPGDTARKPLTRPLVMFALMRALVTAGTVALAFGLDLSHGYWMPIAAMVAMKPNLEQSTLTAAQRVVGAVTAALLLLIPASEHGLRLFLVERALEVVALVLFMHGWRSALGTTRSTARPSPQAC